MCGHITPFNTTSYMCDQITPMSDFLGPPHLQQLNGKCFIAKDKGYELEFNFAISYVISRPLNYSEAL